MTANTISGFSAAIYNGTMPFLEALGIEQFSSESHGLNGKYNPPIWPKESKVAISGPELEI